MDFLVSNDIVHNMPRGWVEVRTGMRGGQPVLSLANSGPLIPAAEVNRLFQPFQRLGASRTGNAAHEAVQAAGGQLRQPNVARANTERNGEQQCGPSICVLTLLCQNAAS